MDTIGLDLHKRESQLSILTEDGELIERRIATSRERFTLGLGNWHVRTFFSRRRPRVSGSLGTGVARARGNRGRSELRPDVRDSIAAFFKTAKRDARTLCDACRGFRGTDSRAGVRRASARQSDPSLTGPAR